VVFNTTEANKRKPIGLVDNQMLQEHLVRWTKVSLGCSRMVQLLKDLLVDSIETTREVLSGYKLIATMLLENLELFLEAAPTLTNYMKCIFTLKYLVILIQISSPKLKLVGHLKSIKCILTLFQISMIRREMMSQLCISRLWIPRPIHHF